MKTRKRVAILGSTGSIGRSTLEVIAALPDRFEVVALACGQSWRALAEQSRQWQPRRAACWQADAAEQLRQALSGSSEAPDVACGEAALVDMATAPDVDVVVCAIVGAIGVKPALAALQAGKTVALANKEALVVTGELMMKAARENGGALVPVDSEHSALLQALQGQKREAVRKAILTASGGPFLRTSASDLARATVADALRHPTWQMGAKITVDSATLVNKALEVIEARWLFDLRPDQLDVVVHPQSIVHGMVEFVDGSLVAQLGPPDMRLPIQYALTFPERVEGNLRAADLVTIGRLDFEAPDRQRFPSLDFAYAALEAGGTMPAVLNAANEAAVERFLAGEIALTEIFTLIRRAMDAHSPAPATMDAIWEADRWARQRVGGSARGARQQEKLTGKQL